MVAGETGPGSIRSLAVTAEDVITAVEARMQRGERVVLRATPPFSGRMRARLHVKSAEDVSGDGASAGVAAEEATPGDGSAGGSRGPQPVHVDPTALLAESAPAYPRPSDTEDELRADPDVDYTVERHHERHRDAVAAWRDSVRGHFVEETTVDTPDGPQTVAVVVLG